MALRTRLPAAASSTSILRDPFLLFAVLIALSSTAVFVLLPLGKVVQLALLGDGASLDLQFAWDSLRRPDTISAIKNSLTLAAISACLSIMVGFIYAYAITRTRLPGKRIFHWLGLLPLVAPPFGMALSALLLFGRQGLVTRDLLGVTFDIYGLKGLAFVQTLSFFPLAYLSLAGVLRVMDSTLEEAAESLAASRFRVFRTITLPLALPGILSAALLVMVQSLQDFGNPILLGGNYEVLVTKAYVQITGLGSPQLGAFLALLLLTPTLGFFLLQRNWLARRSYVTVTGKPGPARQPTSDLRVVLPLFAFVSMIAVLIIVMYGLVVVGAFTKTWGFDWSFTTENIRAVLQRALVPFRSTFVISITSAVMAGVIGVSIAWLVTKEFWGRRLLEAGPLLAFALPGILVGIGYIYAFNSPPFVLTGTAIIVVLALITRSMPVAMQIGTAQLSKVDRSIEEASASLGASSMGTYRRIVLPIMKHALFAGLVFGFIRSTTAVSSVVFLVSPGWRLMSIEILQSVQIARYAEAAAWVVLLLVLVATGAALLQLVVWTLTRERSARD